MNTRSGLLSSSLLARKGSRVVRCAMLVREGRFDERWTNGEVPLG